MGNSTFVFLLTCLLFTFISSSHVMDVYRMLQFDKLQKQLGCRKTSMNAAASTVYTEPGNTTWTLGKVSTFSRYVIVLRISELVNKTDVNVLKEMTSRHDTVGVVVLLPKNLNSLSDETIEAFRKLEIALLKQTIEKPVYFTFEDQEMINIYNQLKQEKKSGSGALSESYYFVVSEKEATVVNPVNIVNFQV